MSEIEFIKSQLTNFNVVQVLASTPNKRLKFICNTSTNKVKYLVEANNCPLEVLYNIESAIESFNAHV